MWLYELYSGVEQSAQMWAFYKLVWGYVRIAKRIERFVRSVWKEVLAKNYIELTDN